MVFHTQSTTQKNTYITRKEHATPAQLSGYCKLLGSYKSRIKKDASPDVCADCSKTPHDAKHLFACPAHPTTLIPSDLWSKPVESMREFSYLEEGNLDCDEPRPKANNNNLLNLFQKDTSCTRLECYRHLYKLCLHNPSPEMGARFRFLGKLIVAPCRIAGSAPHKSGGRRVKSWPNDTHK